MALITPEEWRKGKRAERQSGAAGLISPEEWKQNQRTTTSTTAGLITPEEFKSSLPAPEPQPVQQSDRRPVSETTRTLAAMTLQPIDTQRALSNLPKVTTSAQTSTQTSTRKQEPLFPGEISLVPAGELRPLTKEQQKELEKETRKQLRQGVGKSLAERILEYPAEALERFADAATAGIISRSNVGLPERADYEKSIAGTIGEIAGYLVPAAAIERAAATALRPVIGGLSKTAQRAITGGTAGATEAAVQEAGDVAFRGERFEPANIAVGGTVGGAIGAAIPAIGQAINRLRTRRQSIPQELENAAVEAIQARRGTTLSDAMERIRPLVLERMTPPLENPNELAKWVRNHLGDETISLNEVRKLSYEDLRQLADEIRRNMSVYDTAIQVAREQGIPLERLLNRTRPTTEMIQRARMRDVSGANPFARKIQQEPVKPAPPQRQNWFTALFGDVGIGISPFGRRTSTRGVPLTTAEQIVSSPIKREGSSVESAARAAYQNFFDYLRPLKDIDEDAYRRALDASRANNLANVIVRDKLVTPEGTVIGEGLENIFNKVARGRSRDFLDYLVLRHAATRMSLGHQVYDPSLNMTVEKVQDLIRRHEQQNPGFREIAQEFDNFMDQLLRHYGVEEGLISRDLYETLRNRYPYYIPMRRQFSIGEKLKMGRFAASPSGFSGQKAPIRKVSPTGSARRIVDPRRSIIEQIGAWTNAAMRNRVMQRLVEVVIRNPQVFKDIIEIVQNPKGKPDVRKILYDEGVEGFLEELDNDFSQLFKKTRLDQDNIVRAMVNGQPVYLKVKDPEVLKALIGMAPDQANFVMKVFEALSGATKRGATGVLAPMFAIRTLTADLAQALIQSKNPAMHLWDFGHAVFSSIADTVLPKNAQLGQSLRALAQEYRRVGGIYSAVMRGEQNLQRGVTRMNRYPILSPQYIAQALGRIVTFPFRLLEGVANISENVNRMAAFRSEMRRLGFEVTPENIRQAMEAAREITVNWSRRGLQTRNIEKIVPYNNAAVQGLYRFARAWKRNPIKTTAVVMAGVMLPKLYEYLSFHDDPDYQMLPAREKYMNLIVAKNPDGTFVRIKMPYEYAALGAFMVDSLEAVRDGNPEAFKGAADALANTFTPPVVSGALQGITQGGGVEQSLSGAAQATVLGPSVSILSNRNYAGIPIEPMALQDRSPAYRYDERTSAIAKELGRVLNFSPKKIDYIIRAYGGDLARILLPLTSEVGGGRQRDTLFRNFIIDPVFSNNIQNDFYAARERLIQAKRDNTEVGAPLPSWYNEALYRRVTSQAMGSISRRLNTLRDQKTRIQLDQSIPITEKAQRLREIQRQINEILIDVNADLYEAGVPMR